MACRAVLGCRAVRASPGAGLAVGPGRGYIPAMSEGTKTTGRKSTDVSPKNGAPLARRGRPKGVPNKTTTAFRETIQRILDDNSENIGKWIKQLAEGVPPTYDKKGNMLTPGRAPDPAGVLARLGSLAEFAAPRLSRQEQVGDGGGPITVVIRKESET